MIAVGINTPASPITFSDSVTGIANYSAQFIPRIKPAVIMERGIAEVDFHFEFAHLIASS
jgi:hypothetical protein